jgi:hypothetical protein
MEDEMNTKQLDSQFGNSVELKLFANNYNVRILNGERSFGIGNATHFDERLGTILGILEYLNIGQSKKVAIVTDTLFKHQHPEYFNILEELRAYHHNKVPLNIYKFTKGLDFIDLKELTSMKVEMNRFFDKYDILFWEVPHIDEIKMAGNSYYPYLVWLDRFDLISSRDSSIEEIEESLNLFNSLGVNTTVSKV